jgi:hypothetical protein
MNKRNMTMRTILLSAMALCLSFFAQANNTTPDSTDLMPSSELSIGINSPFTISLNNPSINGTKSDLGWQVGILRKHPINLNVDMVFGMMVTKISQKLSFIESTIAYEDSGIRDYMSYYVQMPVCWQFKLGKDRTTFARVGGGLSYMVNNQSYESFSRMHRLDDEGVKLDPMIQQSLYEYREVSPFDIQFRVAFGKKFQFGKTQGNVSIGYVQGLLGKDMGFRTGQLECTLGVTLF